MITQQEVIISNLISLAAFFDKCVFVYDNDFDLSTTSCSWFNDHSDIKFNSEVLAAEKSTLNFC